MIASTQITSSEIFAFIAVFKLLSPKAQFIIEKTIESVKNEVNYCRIINYWNTKILGYF